MAKRPAFYVHQGKVVSEMYSFEWYSGFAVSQKQKSIKCLHDAIIKADGNAKPLEISTKSEETIGIIVNDFKIFTLAHCTDCCCYYDFRAKQG